MELLFAGESREKRNYYPMHTHEHWEIVYTIEGEGTLTIAGSKIPFKRGTIICEPPMYPHSPRSQSGMRDEYVIIKDFVPLSSVEVPVYCDDENGTFRALFDILLRTYFAKGTNYKNICNCILESMYQYLVSKTESAGGNKAVDALKTLIGVQFNNAYFDLGAELDKMGYSLDHMRRLFKGETGKTPTEYLTGLRISYAKKLLKEYSPEYTVRDVASMSGFNDPYYFSRVFSREVGMSPTAYADSYRDKK